MDNVTFSHLRTVLLFLFCMRCSYLTIGLSGRKCVIVIVNSNNSKLPLGRRVTAPETAAATAANVIGVKPEVTSSSHEVGVSRTPSPTTERGE